MSIQRRFGVAATVRPSFALYNTFEDVDRLAETLHEIAVNRAD
jgi:cysteine desulfurase/selenocysteine lyase